ncbi:hypothetical protein [Mesonia oceanica]|uniref:Uncharacterized protein n=1 Tax=Mesonia oceanica TaxID=2687242 RepID=A0AC61Y8Z6_9FLAO|nr:hypothetical protein [Mesonia oceanica]VVV00873.1 hypothetical protein FVB9532_02149 [Mesonia oceanica]|tara:strand:- start:339 stop:557 length:219 start_codon:yes stop_codon:yes gene_type:complete
MEYRNLGNSGLKVPVLSLGTGTFGGTNEFFQRWGQTDVDEAKRPGLLIFAWKVASIFLTPLMCTRLVMLKLF